MGVGVGDASTGKDIIMTSEEERIRGRAELLPEERAAGSDDPEGQAEALLRDSDVRTHVPDAAPDTQLERRRSEDTV